MDNFDKETFIDEVEKRPVIWDTDCPEYSNRILKKKAWDELTEIFADPSYSKEKKIMFNMQLQRKWKNLRDTYIKEYKKVNSSPGAPRVSHYIYYSSLSFLEKCLQNKLTTSTNDSKDMEVDQVAKATELLNSMSDSISELMETASTLEKSSNKSKPSQSEPSLSGLPVNTWPKVNYLESQSRDTVPSMCWTHNQSSSKRIKDDDELFCLSLYKEIRKVPEHNRLDLKIKLLRVIQAAQMLPLNKTQQAFHQDTKAKASSNWFDAPFKKRFPTSNPETTNFEITIPRENLENTLKVKKSALAEYAEERNISLLQRQTKEYIADLMKIMRRASSDSSLSSDTIDETKMQTD